VRILAITSSYPRYEGDATAPFVESLVRSVAALGHEVHVLVPQHRSWNRPQTQGTVHFHPYRYSPRASWTPWGYSQSLSGGESIRKPLYAVAPSVLVSAIRAGRRLLARDRFDVVHVHWVIPNGPIGALVSRGRVPLVVSLHGSDMAVAERSRAPRRAARWTFARAAAVTAPSQDLLVRAGRLGAEGLELVPYGADVDALSATAEQAAGARLRLGLDRDAVVVMGIGRLIPVKGFDVLVEAHALAIAKRGDVRLVLVGDGDQREALQSRVAALGVAQSVVFVGSAAHHEIPALLGSADIVAVPSIRSGGYVDGLPNVALEAMAAAKPLVASRVGGLPDLVRPGENGLLVDERDPRQLADAVLRLAGEPELRERLGRAAREEIRTARTWDSVASRVVEVYERAIARS
jgi:phosphatidylinositol alpha-1,6-mannosyltransferase